MEYIDRSRGYGRRSGLIIKKEWLDKIFDKKDPKLLEVRGHGTKKRGTILLIESGSKCIVGQTDIIDSISLSQKDFYKMKHLHKIECSYDIIPYNNPHGWMLENTIKYENPIPYNHPKGAVIWVKDLSIGKPSL